MLSDTKALSAVRLDAGISSHRAAMQIARMRQGDLLEDEEPENVRVCVHFAGRLAERGELSRAADILGSCAELSDDIPLHIMHFEVLILSLFKDWFDATVPLENRLNHSQRQAIVGAAIAAKAGLAELVVDEPLSSIVGRRARELALITRDFAELQEGAR